MHEAKDKWIIRTGVSCHLKPTSPTSSTRIWPSRQWGSKSAFASHTFCSSPFGDFWFTSSKDSGKRIVLIFLRVWSFDSHALYISSADDSGRFLQNPREVAQIASGQNEQSMRVKGLPSRPKLLQNNSLEQFFCNNLCNYYKKNSTKRFSL